MKSNIMILNKRIKENGTISFILWTYALYELSLLKNVNFDVLPTIKIEHAISMGYWVNLNVTEAIFEKVISEIKRIFKDCTEDFEQKTWGEDYVRFGERSFSVEEFEKRKLPGYFIFDM